MKTDTDGHATAGPPREPAVAGPHGASNGTNNLGAGTASAVPSTGIDRRRGRKPSPRSGHNRLAGLILIGPNLALFSVFVLVPIVGGLLLSFTTWDITNGLPKWVGLANYHRMFADPLVWQAVLTTLKFILFGVVPTVFIALGLAMLINVRFRFVGAVRSLYLIPAAMSFAASAVVWRYIFLDGPGFGVLDYVISRFGVTPPDWLASPTWALPALDIITVWLSLPAATVLYLAALQRIPDSLIEAAALDGAGPIRRARHVIWPRRPLHDGARRHCRPSFLYQRLVRPGQHPDQGRPAVRHPDAYLLHFCHRLRLRLFRLRGRPVSASGCAYRRHPPRPVGLIEVDPKMIRSARFTRHGRIFWPSSSGSYWRRPCSTWSRGR